MPLTESGVSPEWRAVIHGNNKFVAVSSNGDVAISEDGTGWQITEKLSANYYERLAYGLLSYEKDVIGNSQTIIPTRSIAPNAVDEISGGITLSAGDQIRVFSESPDLIAQVYGVEIA
jgi:hypothetical protein